MRLSRMRLTVGRLMLAVAAFSLTLRMGITAYHVEHDPTCRWHYHIWVRSGGPDDYPEPTVRPCISPFWPQYWRNLLGRPWPGRYECDCWDGTSQLFGIGVGTECRPYRLVGTIPVAWDEEVQMIESSLRSLKTLGLGATQSSNPADPITPTSRDEPSPVRSREDTMKVENPEE